MTDTPAVPPVVARTLDAERIRTLAGYVRLHLPAGRERVLQAALTDLLAGLDRVGEIPLGETPPATAFDARWA